jgi:hypothetical protein
MRMEREERLIGFSAVIVACIAVAVAIPVGLVLCAVQVIRNRRA